MKTQLLTDALAAAELLQKGEVVALPTETVYGLAGNATDPKIVKKIFEAKERPAFDPLIVHLSDSYLREKSPLEKLVHDQLLDPAVLSWKNKDSIEQAMNQFWPGPLTMILPKGKKIPAEVTSDQDTVGIRCPKHPLFQKVLHALEFPLAAPSANRFGRISPTTAEHVQKELEGRISGILDGGACEVGVESSIIKITETEITLLRPGKISISELVKIFQLPVSPAPSLLQAMQDSTLSPGQLDEHYAPRKPLYLLPASFEDSGTSTLLAQYPESKNPKAAWLAMSGFHPHFQRNAKQESRILSPEKSLEEMAKKLFSTLRELDENEKVSVIFADSPVPILEGLGASIFDRLKRASRNKPSSPA